MLVSLVIAPWGGSPLSHTHILTIAHVVPDINITVDDWDSQGSSTLVTEVSRLRPTCDARACTAADRANMERSGRAW